jgi:hypothetical protein
MEGQGQHGQIRWGRQKERRTLKVSFILSGTGGMMEGKGESKRGDIEKRAVPEKSRSRGALKSDDDGEAAEMPQASNSPPTPHSRRVDYHLY